MDSFLMRALVALIGWILTAGAAGGCANISATKSGYLSDYSRMKPDGSKKLIYAISDEQLERVSSFVVEEPVWQVAPERGRGIDEAQRSRLLKEFRQSLVAELSVIRPVVDEPQEGSVRVRSAVTSVTKSNPVVNVILWIVIVPLVNGGAATEVELVTASGEQLAAVSMAWTGGPVEILGFFSETGHARDAVKKTAKTLRRSIPSTMPAMMPPSAQMSESAIGLARGKGLKHTEQ